MKTCLESLQEGHLTFNFGACPWYRIEDYKVQGLAAVDFLVQEADRWLLIEVKDPGQPEAKSWEQDKWREPGHIRNKVETSIVPKARDSFFFLHLMEQDDRPIDLVFILSYPGIGQDALDGGWGRLRERLEMEIPGMRWKRRYIRQSFLIRPEHFSRVCPPFSVSWI